MKKFLALVLALVMTMSLVTIGANATDVGYTDDAQITNVEAVEVLNALGIMGGYADGSFRPQANLTRGAGAKLIAYLVLGQAAADKLKATYTVFSDVTDGVGLAAYIEWAAAQGIVDGYGDGNFGPYNALTEYAFGKMLLGALGYDSAKEGYVGAGWQKNVYAKATALDIFDGTESFGACDRDTAARMEFGALQSKIVVYGDAQLGGKYYWHGQVVTDVTGATVKDTAIELADFLFDLYDADLDYGTDVFGRPGHKWSYDAADWSKFYMDTPVAEYTTQVTACDILVDLGVAEASNTVVTADHVVDGYLVDATYRLSHKSAISVDGSRKWCTQIPVGHQGTLTQVFEVGTNSYRVTEIDTALAQVTYVQNNVHYYSAYTYLDIWNTQRQAANKATGNVKMENVVALDDLGYAQYDYVLVNATSGSNLENVIDYAGTTAISSSNDRLVVIGVPGVISEAKMTKVAADKSYAYIDGTYYDTNDFYSLSQVTGLVKANVNKAANFFVDQYGNLIGDVEPASAAPVYGRIDALSWIDPRTDVNDEEYVSANLVKADASQGSIVLDSWKNGTHTSGALTEANAEGDPAKGEVSDYKTQNSAYSVADNMYGVVQYSVNSDGNYDAETVGEWLYKASAATLDDETAAPAKADALTNSDAFLGYDKNGTEIYADSQTQFLVYLGDGEYAAYTGIKNLPTMTGIAGIVVVVEPGTSGDATRAYADFVYVHQPAIFAGETVCAYVINTSAYEADADYYYYSVWVDGQHVTVKSKESNLFASGSEGMYDISFSASAEAVSVATCDEYVSYTVVDIERKDYIVAQNDGGRDDIDVSAATVYYVYRGTNWVYEGSADYIAANNTILVAATRNVADVIYIIY